MLFFTFSFMSGVESQNDLTTSFDNDDSVNTHFNPVSAPETSAEVGDAENSNHLQPLPTKPLGQFTTADVLTVIQHFLSLSGPSQGLRPGDLHRYTHITNLLKRVIICHSNRHGIVAILVENIVPQHVCQLLRDITQTISLPESKFYLHHPLLADLITIVSVFTECNGVLPLLLQAGIAKPLIAALNPILLLELDDFNTIERIFEVVIGMVNTKPRYREKFLRGGVIRQLGLLLPLEPNPKEMGTNSLSNPDRWASPHLSPILSLISQLILALSLPVLPSERELQTALKRSNPPPPPQIAPNWRTLIDIIPLLHTILSLALLKTNYELIDNVFEAVAWLSEVGPGAEDGSAERIEDLIVVSNLLPHVLLAHFALLDLESKALIQIEALSLHSLVQEQQATMLQHQQQWAQYKKPITLSIDRILTNLQQPQISSFLVTRVETSNFIQFLQSLSRAFDSLRFSIQTAEQHLPLFLLLCVEFMKGEDRRCIGDHNNVAGDDTNTLQEVITPTARSLFIAHLTTIKIHFPSFSSESHQSLILETFREIALLEVVGIPFLRELAKEGWLLTLFSQLSPQANRHNILPTPDYIFERLQLVALFLETGEGCEPYGVNPFVLQLMTDKCSLHVLQELTYHIALPVRELATEIISAFFSSPLPTPPLSPP